MKTDFRAFFDHLRGLLTSGAITHERAQELALPKLNEMNATGEAIAKKHGRKFRPFTFSGMMR